MNNPQPQEQRLRLVDEDPFGPSYPQSALQYLPYRIFIVVFAVFMIIIGKSSLPTDQVPCIQDVILDGLQPVTNFYIDNRGFGLFLRSVAQLIVDAQLILFPIYWFFKGNSLRYPLGLAIIGISKILLNVLFVVKPIDNAFTDEAFPSFVFGQNLINSYFFSGIMCLMMHNLLELYELNHKLFFKIQIGLIIYLIWILLSMRLNFFMDIATALVFMHYVFYFLNDRIQAIDRFAFVLYDKITGQNAQNRSKMEEE